MTRFLVPGVLFLASSLFGMAAAQVELPAASKDAATAEAPIPDESRLKTRILEFYRALGSKNAQVLYEMQTPYLRSDTSFDAFKLEAGLDEAWLSQPATRITVELDQKCYCREWPYPDSTSAQRCVLLLRGTEEATGAQPSASKRLLAMWDYTNGEWFYGSPGEGDHCPADAELRRGTPQGPPGAAGAPAGLPDEARLKARIKAYSKAVESKDARAMYELQTPYIRAHMSFDDYKRDWRLDEAWSKQPRIHLTSELNRSCSCADWMYPDGSQTLRCVLLLQGTYGEAGARPEKVRWLDMWEYVKGEWYFGIPGEGDQCPSADGAQPSGADSSKPASAVKVALPDEQRLQVRLQEFYSAIVSKDTRVMYEMWTPFLKSRVSFVDYTKRNLKYHLELVAESTKKVAVSVEQVCLCNRWEYPAGAERKLGEVMCQVLVNEVQEDASGRTLAEKHLDDWQYDKGEWFYSGSVKVDNCRGY